MSHQEDIQADLETIRRHPDSIRSDVLEALPYRTASGGIWVEITHTEFTSLCPKTGLPDFGTVTVRYRPDRHIVELKSLKYYFLQFRNTGIFYEHAVPLIEGHLVSVLDPFEMEIEADFSTRGGLHSRVTSRYVRPPAE